MRLSLPVVALFAVPSLFAEVKADPFFGDHMVVQRDKPVTVFGSADPGEPVCVVFDGRTGSAKADAGGRWIVRLAAHAADVSAKEIRIQGPRNEVVVKDVLVGDVWVTAGQSNMEFRLGSDAEAGEALASAADPGLRLLTHAVPGSDVGSRALGAGANKRLYPDYYYAGSWAVSSRGTAAGASAVGYWFAKKIRAGTGVPVGLVGYAIGGAPIESFLARDALKRGGFGKKLSGDWMKNTELPAWCRARAAQNLAKVANAPGDSLGKNHGYKPAFAWEAGPGRITDFPVAGFLWYQGESNAIEPARVAEYPGLQALMIADWRERWKNPKLPFYFVQLSACESGDRSHWGEFRDLQRKSVALSPAPVGMAVSYDFGPPPAQKSEVHPKRKRPVGERLARLALHDVYGQSDLEYSGPEPVRAYVKSGSLVVKFSHAKGLSARGEKLIGFEIASGAGGKFVEAGAKVLGDTVELTAPGVSSPKVVRYAWASYCAGANLVNGDDLPASTFEVSVK